MGGVAVEAGRRMLHFRNRRCRRPGKDERETEITLSQGVIALVVIAALVLFTAAGLVPGDVFANVVSRLLRL